METQSTAQVAATVEDVFRKVAAGIQSNKGFTPSDLLLFIHGLISNTIPQLRPKPK